ncbi:MAG: VCBS repeat-containing protein [Bryobacterales bacterium]|nr:VCBS repeat-containing protein [Bryobacterales bacterium]
MRRKGVLLTACLLGAAAATLLVSQQKTSTQTRNTASKEELLWTHRNLGKAFYENPTTQIPAVEEFKKAFDLAPDSARERLNYGLALLRAGKTTEGMEELKRVQAQDPSLPHTWFNLGVQYKKAGEAELAIAQMEHMAKLVPDDAVVHYNLGALYKLVGRGADAIAQFVKASELGPHLAAPHFQLFNSYRVAGNRDEAQKRLARFQELKKAQEVSGISEDMEWSDYSEVYDPIDPSLSSGDVTDPAPVRFNPRTLQGTVGEGAGALALDFDADSRPDLLAWSASGGLLYRSAATFVPLDVLKPGRSFAAGDIDNDGFPELCMLTDKSAELIRNRKGAFEPAAKTLAAGRFVKALWVDYDHDYDLDLVLIGAKPVVLRNQGEAGMVEQANAIPFVSGTPADAVVLRVIADSKANDIVVTYRDRASVIYRDRLAGRYDVIPLAALPQGAGKLQVADWNHDGQFDLAYIAGGALGLLANRRWTWVPQATPAVPQYAFAIEDVSNHGVSEIIAGDAIYPLTGAPRKAAGLKGGGAMVAADFNADGRVDLAVIDKSLEVFENATQTRNRWFVAKLSGIKNRKLAEGSEVEVRSGKRYQKKIYAGYPLTFGLRGYEQLDMVRITWPNGLIQNEAKQPVGRMVDYKEAQRLSGSCPMIFTWNGRGFEFVTDVLGVAPLGASSGDGSYFATDHDEYVSIPGGMLRARDGFYDLRITEELSEVTYLDQLKLIAVDHPAKTEIYSNDKWKAPPFPGFRLFGTERRIYPERARDGLGHDVRAALLSRDKVYADRFARRMDNTAQAHALEIDFGKDAPNQGAFLVLNGWVDWADGSTFLKQAQEPGRALQPPYLQVRDPQGNWRTVIDDMGIPSGKTKTIAVDLSGRFLSSSREVRIVSNLCVFWDEVFLGVEEHKPDYRLIEMPLRIADLRFHGFSKAVIHPERKQPEHFHYSPASLTSAWNPTPGFYTRFGDVKTLLATPDDRFVIMGSGDEIELRFEAGRTDLPDGWTRDFLLLVDGWAKDSDPNTAYSQTVEPLPFHAMSRYPYPTKERYPDSAEHRRYREEYNTRPALRLLRSLAR